MPPHSSLNSSLTSSRRVIVFAGVCVLVGILAGYTVISYVLKNRRYQSNFPLSPKMTSITPSAGTQVLNVWTSDDPTTGALDARVTIVEFGDFECPYCLEAYPVIKNLRTQYQGTIRLQYRDFPVSDAHPHAQSAAEAAECAHAQGKFWEYHDLLFENSAHLTREDLGKYARQLDLNLKMFNQCLDGRVKADEVVADFNNGRALGVNGTPTFFINGVKYEGALSEEEFKDIVEGSTQ
ncbi:MAG: DsbA family protein [Patescibacteria group bacterium]